MSNKLNPNIPLNSIQYFSNARGVNYLPSLETEWKNSGYLPRVMLNETLTAATLAGAGNPGYDWYYSNDPVQGFKYFSGANRASIWHYYNEEDHKSSLRKIRDLGINCIRVPLCFYAWTQFGDDYLAKVKSFLGVCEEEKVRVQFTVWNGELNLASVYFPEGVLHPEPTALNTDASASFATSLAVASLREPNPLQAENATFFTASAIPYLDALANSVKDYQSMWAFDLCNKPTSQYLSLCASSYTRLNTSLSSTNIKYTFTPLNGVQVYEDTNYLDNGKGTGPSGSFYNSDIRTLSGSIDFISIPFVANNAYATNRYLAAAASGSSVLSLYKPFMVYDTYDPTKLQNLDTTLGVLAGSSVGYFSNMGIVDSPFSIGNSVSPNSNVYSDGEYRDSSDASSVLLQAKDTNWFSRTQLKSANLITQKGADPLNVSGGYYYGTDVIGDFNNDLYVSADETKWTDQKWYYVNRPEQSLARRSQSSNTYLGSKGGVYADSLVYQLEGASSLSVNSFEANLGILYDFDTYFPKISSYPFGVDGANWQAINATMIYRNEFLQLLAKYVIDYSDVPYAELRNSVYDTNPIPHYEREELIELIEVMTNPHRYVNRNPTTTRLADLTSTKAYEFSDAIYGTANSGPDFSTYYDTYYRDLVAQLQKCLMWIFREGTTNPDFKIVSDSFLSSISFEPSSLRAIEVYPITPIEDQSTDYIAESLSSLQSPTYTVEVYDPSSGSWASSFVFQASGTGGYRELVGTQVTGIYSGLKDYWSPSGSNAPCHFTTFGLSGLANIRISRLTGFSIDASIKVFPSRSSKTRQFTATTKGGVTYFEGDVYIGDKLWLEFKDVNLTVSSPLFIFADPFKPARPAGLINYSGETRMNHLALSGGQTTPNLNGSIENAAWETINWGSPGNPTVFSSLQTSTYFGPGIHYVSAGLPIAPSSTYYIDANAYIIGGFDCASAHGSKFIGRGVISPGELYSRVFLYNIVVEVSDDAPTFYGSFGASWSSMNEYGQEYRNTVGLPEITVEGITTTNQHFWANGRKIIKSFNHCKIISPWTYNTDYFKTSQGKQGGSMSVKNCLGVVGDDGLTVWGENWVSEISHRNIVMGSMRTSPFYSYYTSVSSPYFTVVKDVDVYSYAIPGTLKDPQLQSFSRNAIFAFYDSMDLVSSSVVNYAIGNVNGVFEDIAIEGGDGHPVYHPLFRIGNNIRPGNFGGSIPPCGLLSNVSFTNINVTPSSFLPSSLTMSSTFIGVSSTSLPGQTANQPFNRPQDLTITNLKINQSPDTFLLPDNVNGHVAWYDPLSGTNSVTDPTSVDGSSAGIIFKTT